VKKLLPALVLLVVFAALLGYVLLYENPGEDTGKNDKIQLQKIDDERIKSISLDDGNHVILLVRDGNSWKIKEPVEARTARHAVNNVLDAVCDFEVEREVEEDPGDLSQYGLDPPSITVTTSLDDGSEEKIFVGASVPVGAKYYVMKNPGGPVYTVASHKITALRKGVPELRDSSIADDFTRSDVVQVSVLEKDRKTVCLRREEPAEDAENTPGAAGETGTAEEEEPPAEWYLEGRPESDCEPDAEGILGNLSFTDAEEFVDNPGPLDTYGLSSPSRSLVLTFKDGTEWKFDMGHKDQQGRIYLRNTQRDEIYLVSDRFMEKIDSMKKTASKL